MTQHDLRAARLRQLFAQDPGNPDLACELADALSAAGDPAEALSALASLPDARRAEPQVAFRCARLALVSGDFAAAVAGYQAMIDAGADGLAVRHDLAFARMCEGRHGDALEVLREGEAAFGESADLSLLRARVEAMSGQLENAIHAADDALRLRPGDANALGVKALALFDHGDHAQAMQAARQALSHDADQHEALLAAASINLAQQEFADARALLERGLHRHPQSGRALSAYGQVLMAADELPAATDVLAQATLAMPGHIGTWHALAWSQLLQGHVQRAEASYRAAYEIDRNFGDTHGGLALIDALAGRLDEAEAGVRRALRLDPNAVTARYAQAIIRREQGDDAQADALMAALVPEDALRRGMTPAEFGQRLRNIIASGQR